MKKPIPNSFELKKIKLLKGGGGGLDVTYTEASSEGHDTLIDTINRKSCSQPHPDLTKIIKQQNKVMAKVHNLLAFNVLDKLTNTAKTQEAYNTLKPMLKDIENEILKEIEVTGINISGDENNRAVIITSIHKHNNESIALNSPLIRLAGEKWGVEFGLSDDIEDMIVEVKNYLFEGKAANPELFDDSAEEEGSTEEEGPEEEGKEESAEKEEVAA